MTSPVDVPKLHGSQITKLPMPNNRYTMREEDDGTWFVVDIFADAPVTLNGIPMVRLHMEEADDLVDLFNAMDRKRRSEM